MSTYEFPSTIGNLWDFSVPGGGDSDFLAMLEKQIAQSAAPPLPNPTVTPTTTTFPSSALPGDIDPSYLARQPFPSFTQYAPPPPPDATPPLSAHDTPSPASQSSSGDGARTRRNSNWSSGSGGERPAIAGSSSGASASRSSRRVREDKRKVDRDDELVDEQPVGKSQHTTRSSPGTKPPSPAGESPPSATDGDKPAKRKNVNSQKRKEQNRAAQRAFRERKEKHVRELEEKVAAQAEENANLRDLLSRLQQENMALRNSAFTFSFPHPQSGSSGASPPFGNTKNIEQPQPQQPKPLTPPGSASDSPAMQSDPSLFAPSSAGESPLFSPAQPNSSVAGASAPSPSNNSLFGAYRDSGLGSFDALPDLFGDNAFDDFMTGYPPSGGTGLTPQPALSTLSPFSPPRTAPSPIATFGPPPSIADLAQVLCDPEEAKKCPQVRAKMAELGIVMPPHSDPAASGPEMRNAITGLIRAIARETGETTGQVVVRAWKEIGKPLPAMVNVKDFDLDNLCDELKAKATCTGDAACEAQLFTALAKRSIDTTQGGACTGTPAP